MNGFLERSETKGPSWRRRAWAAAAVLERFLADHEIRVSLSDAIPKLLWYWAMAVQWAVVRIAQGIAFEQLYRELDRPGELLHEVVGAYLSAEGSGRPARCRDRLRAVLERVWREWQLYDEARSLLKGEIRQHVIAATAGFDKDHLEDILAPPMRLPVEKALTILRPLVHNEDDPRERVTYATIHRLLVEYTDWPSNRPVTAFDLLPRDVQEHVKTGRVMWMDKTSTYARRDGERIGRRLVAAPTLVFAVGYPAIVVLIIVGSYESTERMAAAVALLAGMFDLESALVITDLAPAYLSDAVGLTLLTRGACRWPASHPTVQDAERVHRRYHESLPVPEALPLSRVPEYAVRLAEQGRSRLARRGKGLLPSPEGWLVPAYPEISPVVNGAVCRDHHVFQVPREAIALRGAAVLTFLVIPDLRRPWLEQPACIVIASYKRPPAEPGTLLWRGEVTIWATYPCWVRNGKVTGWREGECRMPEPATELEVAREELALFLQEEPARRETHATQGRFPFVDERRSAKKVYAGASADPPLARGVQLPLFDAVPRLLDPIPALGEIVRIHPDQPIIGLPPEVAQRLDRLRRFAFDPWLMGTTQRIPSLLDGAAHPGPYERRVRVVFAFGTDRGFHVRDPIMALGQLFRPALGRRKRRAKISREETQRISRCRELVQAALRGDNARQRLEDAIGILEEILRARNRNVQGSGALVDARIAVMDARRALDLGDNPTVRRRLRWALTRLPSARRR